MFILQGFKSFVSEVRILKGLRGHFAEVRILKGIVSGEELVAASKEWSRGWLNLRLATGEACDILLPTTAREFQEKVQIEGFVGEGASVCLNTEVTEVAEGTEKERGNGGGEPSGGAWPANINHVTTIFYYCQGIVLCGDVSNVRRGSGMERRSWREICSLVRRERQESEVGC